MAWFVTSHLKVFEVAPLLKTTLEKFYARGIHVRGIVFDGLPANFTTVEVLGASQNIQSMKHYISHPTAPFVVYVTPDPCHMIKLLRNLLGEKEIVYIEGFEMPARWKHIEHIVTFQTKIGFRLGNKPRDSVSKTIQYLREVVRLPEVMIVL